MGKLASIAPSAKFVILSKRSASKDLRTFGTLKGNFGA